MDDAVLVFTGRSIDELLGEGGSQAWVLDRARAARCTYVVCSQNRESARGGQAEHGAAFLVGRISGVEPAPEPERPGRYIIRFNDYALVDRPRVWQHWRNPVRYTSLADLGIDPQSLQWQTLDGSLRRTPAARPLTIEEAKRGLAAHLGVAPDAIEITIRA